MRKNLNIAIVGATGLVGRKIIEVINERKLEANYFLFAYSAGLGKEIEILNKKYIVQPLILSKLKDFNLNYAFFAIGTDNSKNIVPEFVKNKIVVIDNSNAFRRLKNVPLVVPQVNGEQLKKAKYLIANPNCSTIQLVTALKPLDKKFKIKRVIVSTYQAVSGAGQKGINDLENNTTSKFDYPIRDNIIPHIDVFLPNGYTKEEDKLIFESKKIMERPDLEITATASRVPVRNCHCESVNVEFEKQTTVKKILKILKQANNVIVKDDVANKVYPMPLFCDGKDEVFVGRIRKDFSKKNCFNLWIVADNLRRGAASNAVDILEELEKKYEK